MEYLKIKAAAKINLCLDILGKRPDGYHDIKTIMQTVNLFDTITLEKIQQGIELTCDNSFLPTNSFNTAYKAANLLISKYGIGDGVRITIEKKIPTRAGLGGGSSDAAAVLLGMNSMFSLGISIDDMVMLGKEIGADVPYCLLGGTMLAEGIGEVLTKVSPLPPVWIVMVKPDVDISTAWAYKNLNLLKVEVCRPDTHAVLEALKNKDTLGVAKNTKNVFETVTNTAYPIIAEIKNRLKSFGAAGSAMSGSGSAVFGLFLDSRQADAAYASLSKSFRVCFSLEPTEKSVIFVD